MLRTTGIALVILLTLALVPPSAGTGGGTVILVTDNEADLAMARCVASLLNASLVVSPWGTYDPSVSAEILALNPEWVIVIGGPVAVPPDYTVDFDDFGIAHERWYGETRYETNLAIVENLKKTFPGEFERVRSVFVVNGRDGLALRELIRQGVTGFVVLTDSGRVNESLKILWEFEKLENLTYVGTFENGRFIFTLDERWLDDFVRKRPGVRIWRKGIPPSAENTREILLSVQNRTERAEKLLDGLRIPAARRGLEMARELLERAWREYYLGNYGKAYRLGMMAEWRADFVIARSYLELMTVYQGSARLRLERRLRRFEVMVGVLKKRGYDVSDVEELLRRAREALERGDYSLLLNDLIPRIRMELAMKTRGRMGHSWRRRP
ncbi:hypothetical protein [Thermococcus sp.]|uniref:cell wall-binding repeat-containing protein n=1 Tax=Thermococcus sp. TaxID=35749 RepID=UPI00260997FF|nr:hypothetical protein [Thermococcus sp.]